MVFTKSCYILSDRAKLDFEGQKVREAPEAKALVALCGYAWEMAS